VTTMPEDDDQASLNGDLVEAAIMDFLFSLLFLTNMRSHAISTDKEISDQNPFMTAKERIWRKFIWITGRGIILQVSMHHDTAGN